MDYLKDERQTINSKTTPQNNNTAKTPITASPPITATNNHAKPPSVIAPNDTTLIAMPTNVACAAI